MNKREERIALLAKARKLLASLTEEQIAEIFPEEILNTSEKRGSPSRTGTPQNGKLPKKRGTSADQQNLAAFFCRGEKDF